MSLNEVCEKGEAAIRTHFETTSTPTTIAKISILEVLASLAGPIPSLMMSQKKKNTCF